MASNMVPNVALNWSDDQKKTIALILSKMFTLGLEVSVERELTVGPLVTAYRLIPAGGTKVSNIENMSEDIAMALKAEDVLIKRMPGEGSVSVFVPHKEPHPISFLNLTSELYKSPAELPMLFGTDWLGKPFVDDLTLMPHLLVAGGTNSGKSVFLRELLTGIVYKMNADTVNIVLSDTKGVEFTDFVGCPHLLFDRATTPLRTIEYMEELCKMVDTRLEEIGKAGVKNIQEFNKLKTAQGQLQSRFTYVILMIDELADVVYIPNAGRGKTGIGADKLDYLTRKARAAGIHVIAGVQRPSVDVVKGVIKSNFTARVSFRMSSQVDSRVIIDTDGAEHLIARGDMLYKSPNMAGLTRLHSAYVKPEEIRAAIDMVIYRGKQMRLQ